MMFIWPGALYLLPLALLLGLLYVWAQRRRRRDTLRFSSLMLVRAAQPPPARLRRHLPPALLLLALVLLLVGLARPAAVTLIPAGRATVMLVMDVSRSMLQNDIPPSRMAAAQRAALAFIERQNAANQVGIVAFAGFAQLVQPPSSDLGELQAAINNLTTGRHTAMGTGIQVALQAIAEDNPQVAAALRGEVLPATGGGAVPGLDPSGNPAPGGAAPDSAPGLPLDEAGYAPAIIVLLTDGVTTTGPEPLLVARLAAESRVRIYTIGFGSDIPGTPNDNSFFFNGRRFGLDEETLQRIAEMTGGEYYAASSAGELQAVFDRLPTALLTRRETNEISVAFAALAAVLAAGALLLSLLWRPPA